MNMDGLASIMDAAAFRAARIPIRPCDGRGDGQGAADAGTGRRASGCARSAPRAPRRVSSPASRPAAAGGVTRATWKLVDVQGSTMKDTLLDSVPLGVVTCT